MSYLCSIRWRPFYLGSTPFEICKITLVHLPSCVFTLTGNERAITCETNDIQFVMLMPPIPDLSVRLRDQRRERILADQLKHRTHVVCEGWFDKLLIGIITKLCDFACLAVDIAEPKTEEWFFQSVSALSSSVWVRSHWNITLDQPQSTEFREIRPEGVGFHSGEISNLVGSTFSGRDSP